MIDTFLICIVSWKLINGPKQYDDDLESLSIFVFSFSLTWTSNDFSVLNELVQFYFVLVDVATNMNRSFVLQKILAEEYKLLNYDCHVDLAIAEITLRGKLIGVDWIQFRQR